MDVFYSREEMEQRLAYAFRERYRRKDVALTGVLLARPEDSLTRDGVLPHLEYWHYRSDFYTDFFCAGYVPASFVSDAKPVGVQIDDLEWGFSVRAFVELVNEMERETGWDYNGDPCLLLANSYFDGTHAKIDFYRSIRVNFREAIENKAVGTPTEVAEHVFRFAKRMNESSNDPVWEISDRFGHRVLKRGLKDAFLSCLPEWLTPATKAGLQFAVHEHH